MPGDLAAAVDVDHRRAVEGPLAARCACRRCRPDGCSSSRTVSGRAPATTSSWISRCRAQASSYGTASARTGADHPQFTHVCHGTQRGASDPGAPMPATCSSGTTRGQTRLQRVGAARYRAGTAFHRRSVTKLDEARETGAPKPRRPRYVWVFGAIAIVVFLIGLGRRRVPGQARRGPEERQLVVPAQLGRLDQGRERAGEVHHHPVHPRLRRLRARRAALTAQDKQKIAADVTKFKAIPGVSADEVGLPQSSSKDDGVAAVSVPLIGKETASPSRAPTWSTPRRRCSRQRAPVRPPGSTIHSAGAGGVLVAFIDAFSGLDGSLLLSAGIVVIIILLLRLPQPGAVVLPAVQRGARARRRGAGHLPARQARRRSR